MVKTQQANIVAQGATVDEVFRERLAAAPDAPFVKCGADWITFAQLDERTDRLAAGLAPSAWAGARWSPRSCRTGSRPWRSCWPSPSSARSRCPLNYWLKGEFLRYQLGDCGASVLIADGPGYAAARDLLGSTGIGHTVVVDDRPAGNGRLRGPVR